MTLALRVSKSFYPDFEVTLWQNRATKLFSSQRANQLGQRSPFGDLALLHTQISAVSTPTSSLMSSVPSSWGQGRTRKADSVSFLDHTRLRSTPYPPWQHHRLALWLKAGKSRTTSMDLKQAFSTSTELNTTVRHPNLGSSLLPFTTEASRIIHFTKSFDTTLPNLRWCI